MIVPSIEIEKRECSRFSYLECLVLSSWYWGGDNRLFSNSCYLSAKAEVQTILKKEALGYDSRS